MKVMQKMPMSTMFQMILTTPELSISYANYSHYMDGLTERLLVMPNMAKSIRVRYNDRDVDDVTHYELDKIYDEGSIGIGEIGFKFIKTFGRD